MEIDRVPIFAILLTADGKDNSSKKAPMKNVDEVAENTAILFADTRT